MQTLSLKIDKMLYMKILIKLVLLVVILIGIPSAAYACEVWLIPGEEILERLTLEETMEESQFVIVASQSGVGPSDYEGEPRWIEIKIDEVVIQKNKNKSLGEKAKVNTTDPCSYGEAFYRLEENKKYLIFLGEQYESYEDNMEILFSPVPLGVKALEIKDNLIEVKKWDEDDQYVPDYIALSDFIKKYSNNNLEPKIEKPEVVLGLVKKENNKSPDFVEGDTSNSTSVAATSSEGEAKDGLVKRILLVIRDFFLMFR